MVPLWTEKQPIAAELTVDLNPHSPESLSANSHHHVRGISTQVAADICEVNAGFPDVTDRLRLEARLRPAILAAANWLA